jgi:hypothetical protein
MTLPTTVSIKVVPDPQYHYVVSHTTDGATMLSYHEGHRVVDSISELEFANIQEMEAIANAMLAVVKMVRSM